MEKCLKQIVDLQTEKKGAALMVDNVMYRRTAGDFQSGHGSIIS